MEAIHALLAALGLVALTVIVHYESLRAISSITANRGIPPRALSLVVIAGVLLAHLIEICVFAAGFFIMHTRLGLGAIAGDFNGTTLDYFYFSACQHSHPVAGFPRLCRASPHTAKAATYAVYLYWLFSGVTLAELRMVFTIRLAS